MTTPSSQPRPGRYLHIRLTRRDLIKGAGAAGVVFAVSCKAETSPTAPATATISPDAVSPGKVTWLTGDLGNERFDVTLTPGGTGDAYGRQMHGFLSSYEIQNGRKVLVPGIASKSTVSADGKTWTFTIRKGVKFQDGTDLTAKDVAWSLQHLWGPPLGAYVIHATTRTTAAFITGVAQTGADEVTVTTKAPFTGLGLTISEIGATWQGAIMPARTTLHDVNDEEAYDRNPIGAGSLKLVKHVPGVSMTFERFADYYYQPRFGLPTDKRPRFTTLEVQAVPEESTRVAALQAGQADIAEVSAAARKQVEAGGGRMVFGEEGALLQIMMFGAWRPEFPFSDKRVRQALNYAIDKELMRQKLFGADVMVLKGWCAVTPSGLGYTPGLDPYPFDPNKARQLLADAGYPGGKGFGKLIVNTWKSSIIPLMTDSAQLGAQMWRTELGLDVEVRLGEQIALKTAGDNGSLQGQILWRDNSATADSTPFLNAFFGTRTRQDRLHDSPELYALVSAAQSVVDPIEQEKALGSLFVRLRDEAQIIPMGYMRVAYGVGPRVLTWQPDPLTSRPSGLNTITLR